MRLSKRYVSTFYPLLLLCFLSSNTLSAQDVLSLDRIFVTLSAKDETLPVIFGEISQQTKIYLNAAGDVPAVNERFSINVKHKPLQDVLKTLLKDKGCTWSLKKNMVTITFTHKNSPPEPVKKANPDAIATKPKGIAAIKGIVTDNEGKPLERATIKVKGTRKGYFTNEAGLFFLGTADLNRTLEISFTGYEAKQYRVSSPDSIRIVLTPHPQYLTEQLATGYGTTSMLLNTGNIMSVSAREIALYPVSNPIIPLQGRIPGLLISQSSGLPGASLKLRIRGQNSFLSGGNPLFVVDGVPLPFGNQHVNQLTSIITLTMDAGVSPLTSLNPADIENIEVLKDADATAIYGSRGANGVIFITTKKGQAGKATVSADITTGVDHVAFSPRLMNTAQYLEMRNEAFKNDNIVPDHLPGTNSYAPDLKVWDTTRYTNWPKLLTGGNAAFTSANITVSGGSATTQLLFGGSYYRQSSVFPVNMPYVKGALSFSLNHRSADNKFKLGMYGNYSRDKNQLYNASLAAMYLPPNAPSLYDGDGQLNWSEGDEPFQNPMADYLKTYKITKENYLANMHLSYALLPNLSFRAGLGYSVMLTNEHSTVPKAAQNPFLYDVRSGIASFGNNNSRSYIAEPQVEYSLKLGKGNIKMMTGASYQYASTTNAVIEGQGYTNDALLNSLDGAASISNKTTNVSEYRYGALFSRISYNLLNKYVVNLTGRMDGSSKFSPENRLGHFGAIGAAWIFSEEQLVQNSMPFISFGKLRASYGVTGNDQIADYKYLDTWSARLLNPYQNTTTLSPDALYNPRYNWEKNRKLEAAVELGLFNGRLLGSFSYYLNRSSNQLIQYPLPAQTGFNNILKNFNSLIENKGLEVTLSGDIIKTDDLKLNVSVNLTVPKNKLLRFDQLAKSSYNGIFVVREPVNVLNKLRSSGVNPETGLFRLKDVNEDSVYTREDCEVIGSLDPDFYGGLHVNFQYKSLSIELLGDFRKQMAPNYLFTGYLNNLLPGMMVNQPDIVLDRWRQQGDKAQFPRYSTLPTGEVYADKNNMINSSEAYSRADYFKLRQLSVSYILNKSLLSRFGVKKAVIFCKTQNLFTITGYKVGDPETANALVLPTLRSIAGGLQISF
ncbi:SusC/RagA family TonB-linked outer membrane protein [Chitinophaga tropicalis]|uniref:SusC/RagA family TonB-linked outer membrane protein n=1 Tax=Chitinophaga tropicalis TaxID=2683588 RepID=A0A7K1U7G6_9BACT|nr:SusC/RagA family TonB-linked outer membrane protein [Chitinophaga tropicalis]MVT10303.1 SusC/RagA family TonB-linked outer membrane protein [Chitinophaga tropicalis]